MENERKFTRKEIEGRNTRENTTIIIDNVVYDVTQFLEEHPGGEEVLRDNGGRDASRCFRDVGHSEIALEWRDKFRVGALVEEDRWPVLSRAPADDAASDPLTVASLLAVWGPPLVMAALASLLYLYLF